MHRDRLLLVIVWLASAVLVGAGALAAYHFLTRGDALAGRTDPVTLYDDPTLLFTDPGLLGTAVELQVTRSVRSCMTAAGYDYRGPAVLADIGSLLDPAADGYGLAAGPAAPRPQLGDGGPGGWQQEGYEAALYGTALAGAGDAGGGCAAAGRAALDAALDTLAGLPYPLAQLQADAAAHAAWVTGLADWSACMAERGFAAASPNDLIAAQVAALASASGDEARALADQERAAAAADFACRAGTLDRALKRVAADLAPVFVDRNRAQLEALIPPPDGASLAGLGTGDVQLTLIWHSAVDLDLAVTDPTGAAVDYTARTSPSGGTLDRDANFPCDTATGAPVENVFWPPDGAPAGHYAITVSYRTGCGTSPAEAFELVVRLNGDVAHHERGTLDPGSSYTFEFDYGGK